MNLVIKKMKLSMVLLFICLLLNSCLIHSYIDDNIPNDNSKFTRNCISLTYEEHIQNAVLFYSELKFIFKQLTDRQYPCELYRNGNYSLILDNLNITSDLLKDYIDAIKDCNSVAINKYIIQLNTSRYSLFKIANCMGIGCGC